MATRRNYFYLAEKGSEKYYSDIIQYSQETGRTTQGQRHNRSTQVVLSYTVHVRSAQVICYLRGI